MARGRGLGSTARSGAGGTARGRRTAGPGWARFGSPPRFVAHALFCLAAAACATTSTPDLEAEREAAAAVEQRYAAAVNAGDLDALLELYAEDARVVSFRSEPAVGHDAIRAHFGELLGAPGIEISATSERVDVSAAADVATDAGSFDFAFDTPDGRVSGTGRYLLVLRKIEGTWKIVVGMDYSALD